MIMETVDIRKCLEADVARIVRFYNGVIHWLDDHVNYPRWLYDIYPNEHSVRFFAETGSQYVCVKRDSILGTFGLNAEPQGNYRKGRWSQELIDGSYMVLHALAINPIVQRQGVGSEIIRFCVYKAKAEGYKAVRVDIVPTNYPAKRLFEKNGFTYAGDVDLELEIGNIPAFSLYEFNI